MLTTLSKVHKILALAVMLTAFCTWTPWREHSQTDESVLRSNQQHLVRHRELRLLSSVSAKAPTNVSSSFDSNRLLDRNPLPDATADLFRLVTFQPHAPKAEPLPPPPPPPKPTAPAFPYTYFGRMVDINGNTITYLSRDDALIPIHPQQLLDNSYRIEAVTEAQIVVTYVPLEEKIVIAVQSGK